MKSVMRLTLLAFMSLALLSACGGGSDNTLTGDGGGSDGGAGGGPGTVSISSVDARTSTTQISSDGSQTATITAVVKDANNVVVPNVAVAFSADSGTIQVTQGTTDDTGTATATLSTDGSAANRSITVTVTAGGTSDSVRVDVAGTNISISGPSSVAQNQPVDYIIRLTDAAGGGIPNELVTLSSKSGNSFGASTLRTNAQGEIVATLNATVDGADVLTAQASGATGSFTVNVSADEFTFDISGVGCGQRQSDTPLIPLTANCTVTVHWERDGVPQSGEPIDFSTTRGSLNGTTGPVTVNTNGDGDASVTIKSNISGLASVSADASNGPSIRSDVRFIATEPETISVQAENTTIGPGDTSTITAVVRDSNNNLVTNADVSFQIAADSTGGFLSIGTARTNFQGAVQTVYTAGSTSSAQNGVTITASFYDAGLGTYITDEVSLTVAEQAISITLGTGNEIEIVSLTEYEQPYVVQVADAAGNAIANANVELSITSLGYIKGCWLAVDDPATAPVSAECVAGDISTTGSLSTLTEAYGRYVTAVCTNEDLNLNGQIDSGEDTNGNGTLEPGVVAVVTSGNVSTDSTGSATFGIQYPKDRAFWGTIRLTATAEVSGTEQTSSVDFTLNGVADDYNDSSVSPPGAISPYGVVNTCTDPD